MPDSTHRTPNLPTRHGRWLWVGLGVAAAHLLLLWSMQATHSDPVHPLRREADIVPVTLLAQVADGAATGNKPAKPARPAAQPLPRAMPPAVPPASATDASLAAAEPEPATDPAPATETEAKTEPAPELPERQPASNTEDDEQATKLTDTLHAPAPARLFYEVAGQSKGLRYNAEAVLDWRHDGRHYQAMMEISAFLIGSRSQTSSGLLGAEGLEPERFVDRARRERETRFDHETGLVRNGTGGIDLPMLTGTQDKLSVFLQLALRLGQLTSQPAPGDHWTLPVAASRAIESWTFDWRGTEELDLPAGRLQAWHLERKPQQAGEVGVELWVAPELGYLPVRLRLIQDNGDSIEQRLSRH